MVLREGKYLLTRKMYHKAVTNDHIMREREVRKYLLYSNKELNYFNRSQENKILFIVTKLDIVIMIEVDSLMTVNHTRLNVVTRK